RKVKADCVTLATMYASQNHLPVTYFLRQINQESGFNPAILGPYVCSGGSCGRAEGIGQFMSYRHDNFNHWDPNAALQHSAAENAGNWNRHMKDGDNQIVAYMKMLVDYNCGPACSAYKYGKDWYLHLPGQTAGYIHSIMGIPESQISKYI
ncbi:MAG: hypothetical protein J2P37_33030, partial [Ktedonobacteraceae bacterium]|nr:hypothetical protein [Ktedonobacteraceae bacterium]